MLTFTVHSDAEAPAVAPKAASTNDLSGDRHRQLIGWIGVVLPTVLLLLALWRDGPEQLGNLESISAYYYSGGTAAFLGMLFALSLFLFAYRGYRNTERNRYNWADKGAARVAAIAALLVAFFPTAAPAGVSALAWWKPWIGVLHHIGAFALFAMFAIFALWLFRLNEDGKVEAKTWQDGAYLACGAVIVAGIAVALYLGLTGRSIFWPEAAAVIAFAVSWLVKGYAPKKKASGARG